MESGLRTHQLSDELDQQSGSLKVNSCGSPFNQIVIGQLATNSEGLERIRFMVESPVLSGQLQTLKSP